MKSKMWLIICLLLLVTLQVNGETQAEQAQIYYESVNANGAPLNTMDLNYPLLVYKGVTYLPLSWEATQHVGLLQEWDEESQTLKLTSIPTPVPVVRKFESTYYKSQNVDVILSEAKVTYRGLQIEFGDYPLIQYNNVQYVPLTWDFIVGKLGWHLRWNNVEGLVLNKTGNLESIRDERRFKAFASFMQTQNKKLSEDEAARYTRVVFDASDKYGINDTWVMAVFWQESYYDATCTYGKALGAMQIMESTGRGYGLSRAQLFVPEINIDFGVRYLSGLRSYYKGDLNKGTLAYNQGTLRVNRGTNRTWYLEDIVEKEGKIINYLETYLANNP